MSRGFLVIVLSSTVISVFVMNGQAVRSSISRAESQLCTGDTRLVRLPGVPEASGVVASGRTPEVIWSHNDSGEAVLLAFDRTGRPAGRVQVTGTEVTDWEDITAGACPNGSCLYIGDIGDNNHARSHVSIYRVREPSPSAMTTEPAETWTLRYPDGPHDAEALFAVGTELFIVTKEPKASVYRARLTSNVRETVSLERVATVPVARVTGAAASPDGAWVALRTNQELFFYRTAELLKGQPGEPQRFNLDSIGEPQGEGVAFGQGGILYLVGEGGGNGGTLAIITCPLR
jgi:hypothetical protein